jgi:tetrahydromethanopterin S-methyltransferase subunit G
MGKRLDKIEDQIDDLRSERLDKIEKQIDDLRRDVYQW